MWVKSGTMRWAGHAESIVDRKGLYRGLRERDHLKNLGVNMRIILKRMFRIWDWAWTGLLWLRLGKGGYEYSCEYSNEPLGTIKFGEFL